MNPDEKFSFITFGLMLYAASIDLFVWDIVTQYANGNYIALSVVLLLIGSILLGYSLSDEADRKTRSRKSTEMLQP